MSENYQLLEQLGAGSSSQVFLAKDRRTGALVAIKQLKALSNPAVKIRFQREFRAMQRLEHPGIVRVLDFFEHESHPWLVMEYIEGCDLNQWLQIPRELTEVLQVFVRLSSALEAVHREGMVHRDIKPQNIFIRAKTDAPVLFDFGLVKHPDQLGISRDGTMIGTALYMSPEQCRSLAVDSRADLYALGVVLYQTLCGRPVFEGKTIPEVVTGHLSRQPVPPKFYRPDLPQELEDLILKLLAKDQTARFQRASQVRALLETILERDDVWRIPSQQPEVLELSQTMQLTVQALFVAPLIGRDTELRALQHAIDTKTGLIAVMGEAGLGKTRLLQALEVPNSNRVLIRVETQRNDVPYSLIARALLEALEVVPESFDRLSQTDLQELSWLLPALGTTMWFSSFQGTEHDLGLFQAVLNWFDYTRNSVLLAFENVQLADSSSLKLIRHVLGNSPEVKMIASYLPEFQPEIALGTPAATIKLGPLSGAELYQLLPAWLGVNVNAEIAEDLIVRSLGNPWVLEELVKTALELNNWQEPQGVVFGSAPNFSLDGLSGMHLVLQKRLMELPAEVLEVAQVAAILGSEPRFSQVSMVLGWNELRVLDAVEHLLRAKVLRESSRLDDERLSFTHSLYTEVLSESCSLERRREIHATISEVLGNQLEVLQLIEHLFGATRWREVLRVADQALENPSVALEIERVALLAIKAAKHLNAPLEQNKIRARYSEFLLHACRVDEAEQHLRAVFRSVVGQATWHRLELQSRVLLARCLAWQNKPDEALYMLERPDVGFDHDGSLLLERAKLYASSGNWLAARHDALLGLTRARKAGSLDRVVRALGQLVGIELNFKRQARARHLLELLRRIADQSGHLDLQAFVRLVAAQGLMLEGHLAQALELTRGAIALAEQAQDFKILIDAKELLIECLEQQNQYQQARQQTLELQILCKRLGWQARVQHLGSLLATQTLALEEFDAALEYARSALPNPRAALVERLLGFCLGTAQPEIKMPRSGEQNLLILIRNLHNLEQQNFVTLQPAADNSDAWQWWIALTQFHADWRSGNNVQTQLKTLRAIRSGQYISAEQLEDYQSFLTLATSSNLKPETEAFLLMLAQVYEHSHIGVFARDFVRQNKGEKLAVQTT